MVARSAIRWPSQGCFGINFLHFSWLLGSSCCTPCCGYWLEAFGTQYGAWCQSLQSKLHCLCIGCLDTCFRCIWCFGWLVSNNLKSSKALLVLIFLHCSSTCVHPTFTLSCFVCKCRGLLIGIGLLRLCWKNWFSSSHQPCWIWRWGCFLSPGLPHRKILYFEFQDMYNHMTSVYSVVSFPFFAYLDSFFTI